MQDSLQTVLSHFGVKNGELLVAGRPISSIVAEHPTPLYIFDSSVVKWRHDQIRKHLPPEIEVTYAVKANPNLDILKLMGTLYTGVDLASQGEMEKCLQAGIDASRMSFAGPGKHPRELKAAVEAGIGSISIENERELDHIEGFAHSLGKRARIKVRVNPPFELSRAGLKMGGGSKQFGIDSERVPAVIARIRAMKNAEFKGIHIFSGTQNLSPESLIDTFDKILNYASGLRREIGVDLESINMGGGFGIPYFKGDPELDLAAVGQGLRGLMAKYAPSLPGSHLKIELGRYLVGECGLYVSSILYRKISRGGVFLIMDGGMHHHLPASGNMNQSPIRRQMHVVVANKLAGETEKASVVGPLCTPLDNFLLNADLPKAEEGDLIAVLNSGAYGLSISPVNFLSHRAPAEVLL
jgi:diaminopimelate decarboxylase